MAFATSIVGLIPMGCEANESGYGQKYPQSERSYRDPPKPPTQTPSNP